MSRRLFRSVCLDSLPPGVTVEGSALDPLRKAYLQRGIVNIADMILQAKLFFRGPPGHIDRADVWRVFPREDAFIECNGADTSPAVEHCSDQPPIDIIQVLNEDHRRGGRDVIDELEEPNNEYQANEHDVGDDSDEW